ncbi:hypothetical protein ACFL5T_05175 [Gemmatimonadota bacterium]
MGQGREGMIDADEVRAAARLLEAQYDERSCKAHEKYEDRPLDWMVEKLGVRRESLAWSENPYEGHEWDGTVDPFVAALVALVGNEDVGIESGTGTGKTFWLACLVLWFLACFEDSIVVTAAPKEAQLLLHVWKEIGRLFPRFKAHFPEATFQTGKLRMKQATEDREIWAATAFVCGVGADEASATKAQGFHAEHMLIITEETPGVHAAIMVAFENTSIAPHNLRVSVGNPDSVEDELHRFCLEPSTTHIRVSALDHPNVVLDDPGIIPGAVSLPAVERRKRRYAHMPAMYHSRVRGISPEQAFGTALKFVEADHLETLSLTDIRHGIDEQAWDVWCGLDFGAWRFAFLAAVADRAGRLHVAVEYFSQRTVDVTLETRAREIHRRLTDLGAPPERTKILGDAANQTDIIEINAAFVRIESPFRVGAVAMENKMRLPSIERINSLFGRKALLVRRDLGSDQGWRLGQSVASDGRPMYGSRLLWEIKNWRYPDPKEGQAQKQDPDDHTADGADCIAALRYLVMSWWKAVRYEMPEEEPDRNVDTGLEEVLDRIAESQKPTAAQKREAKAFNDMVEEGRRQHANRNFDAPPPKRRKKPPRAF